MTGLKKLLSIVLAMTLMLTLSVGAVATENKLTKDENKGTYVKYDLSTGMRTESPIITPKSIPLYQPPVEGTMDIGELVYDPLPKTSDEGISSYGYDSSWTKITNTSVSPYTKIAELKLNFPSGVQYGTGFMIAPGKILTSAHCLFNVKDGRPFGEIPASIDAMFGRNGSYSYTSLNAKASSFSVNSQWEDYLNADYDYAIITVSTAVSNKTGTFGYTSAINENIDYNLAGYPFDEKVYFGNYLYKDTDSLVDVQTDSFEHYLNCCGGTSGAPIYNNSGVAIGIHSRSTTSKGGIATRITSDVIAFIKQ